MSGSRTVHRAVDVLTTVASHAEGLTLKEISDVLDLPKTSVFDIVKALVHKGLLDEVRIDGIRYKIGLKAFQIGSAFLNDTDIINKSKIHVKRLAEKVNKTAFIAVLEQGYVTYLFKYEPPKAIITTSNIGTKNPAHCTSLGKAILSGMQEKELESALSELKFEKMTANTILTEQALRADLLETKQRGYSVDNREIEEHTLCIGSPVFNHEGHVIAGISISGFYSENRNIQDEGQTVKEAAKAISRSLGYSGEYYG